jgi:ankyrin repeat protein
MAAAGQGSVPVIEQLLALGADVTLKASNGWTARDFAMHTAKTGAVEILESYQ